MKHTFAIQVQINWDKMSGSQQLRYHRMQKRDSNIIKKYLGIIKKEHDNLITLSNRDKYQIDTSLLNRLTLTTKSRRKVPYDLFRSS